MTFKSIGYIIIVLLTASFSVSCQSKVSSPQKKFETSSRVYFSNDSLQINNILFSPLDNSKLWTVNTNGTTYEFSPADSTWKNLKNNFGEYAKGLKASNIMQDTFDENLVWLANFSKGLIAYSKKNKSYTNFDKIKTVTAALYLDTAIIIGTWKGLYTIDRKTQEVAKSATIAEIMINSIEELNHETLLINQKYKYDYKSDELVNSVLKNGIMYNKTDSNRVIVSKIKNDNILISKGDVEKKFNFKHKYINSIVVDGDIVWMPSDYQSFKITRFDAQANKITYFRTEYKLGEFQSVNDENRIWFYNRNMIICFDKSALDFKFIPVDYRLNRVITDSKFIYLSSSHGIEIYNKDHLLSESIDVEKMYNEEEEFSEMAKEAKYGNDKDYKQRFEAYLEITEKFGTSSNIRIQKKIENLKELLQLDAPRDSTELSELRRYFEDEVKDKEFLAVIYMQTIKYLNHQGLLSQAIHYDSLLVRNAPDYQTHEHKEAMKQVVKYNSIISDIYATDLTNDEQLWRVGVAYFDLFKFVGPTTAASTYNMTYPFKYLNKLLQKFPKSDFADNAEYKMYRHIENSTHEGGNNSYNFKAIEGYKAILTKYPHTELKPKIYYRISEMYFSCEASYQEKPKYIDLAKDYANIVLSEFPDYEYIESVKRHTQSIVKKKSIYMWQLVISSDKQSYHPDEPIIITYKLTNIDNRDKSILVSEDKTIPNFALRIHRRPLENSYRSKKEMKLTKNTQSYNKEIIEQLIEAEQTYTETWDIKENARANFRNAPGKFRLKAEGKYEIKAYGSEKAGSFSIPSNTISITIKN